MLGSNEESIACGMAIFIVSFCRGKKWQSDGKRCCVHWGWEREEDYSLVIIPGEVLSKRREDRASRREQERRSGPPPISITSLATSSARSFVFFLFSSGRFVLKASRLVRARCLPARSWLCKRWFDWFVPMHHPFGLVKPDRLASGEGGSRADATRDLSCSCYGQLVPWSRGPAIL